jgi:hypothetical protein
MDKSNIAKIFLPRSTVGPTKIIIVFTIIHITAYYNSKDSNIYRNSFAGTKD